MSTERDQNEIRMSADALYREESFTDRRVGTLRRLVPIKADGTDDAARAVVFEGQASLLTPGGSLPLVFEIEARTLAEAVEKFPGAARTALEETLRELEELRRQAASSIVVPGRTGPGLGGLGELGGPLGGGKIRLP